MSEIINGANMNKAGVYPGWKAKAAADKAADDAAQAAKTEVTVTQVQTSTNGTKIATIGVDDVNTDIYTPAVSVTQVQGSTGATKIATIGVGATSTDIYAPGDEDLVIELHYINFDSVISQPNVTVSETPATVLSAILAGKEIKAKLFFTQNDPQYEYPIMLNGLMAIEYEIDGDYYPEIDFAFIYNDDGSAVSDNDFLAKVVVYQEGESWSVPTVFKYDLQEFSSQG